MSYRSHGVQKFGPDIGQAANTLSFAETKAKGNETDQTQGRRNKLNFANAKNKPHKNSEYPLEIQIWCAKASVNLCQSWRRATQS